MTMQKLHWVRQYAHTTTNMGVAHLALDGAAFTFCGQRIRDSAEWGPEAKQTDHKERECPTCRRQAFKGGRRQ